MPRANVRPLTSPALVHAQPDRLSTLARHAVFKSIRKADLHSAENLWRGLDSPPSLSRRNVTMLQALYRLQEHRDFQSHPYLAALIKDVETAMTNAGQPHTRLSPSDTSFVVNPSPGAGANRSVLRGFECAEQALVNALADRKLERAGLITRF
jgi:hypothetical protein